MWSYGGNATTPTSYCISQEHIPHSLKKNLPKKLKTPVKKNHNTLTGVLLFFSFVCVFWFSECHDDKKICDKIKCHGERVQFKKKKCLF